MRASPTTEVNSCFRGPQLPATCLTKRSAIAYTSIRKFNTDTAA
jgi:hypothetical protein